jgi:glycine/D-amino acid oxidase-like deaminating enzyme
MFPLMQVDDLVGASWLPTDGQASPSDITQSLAKGARMHGAKLHRGRERHRFRHERRPHHSR